MAGATTDRRLLIAAAVALLAGVAGDAFAASAGCRPVSSLPYVIDQAGNYCLTAPLVHGGEGPAILVGADDVTLDLNGFSLTGSAGPGTLAVGIFADTRRGITIQNGSISGFLYAVFLMDDESQGWASGGGHVVRDLYVTGNYFRGIRTEGRAVIVEHCRVARTGGTTVFGPGTFTFGIEVYGAGTQILSNVVDETVSADGGEAVSISISGRGLGTLVEGNIVGNAALPASGASFGLWIGDGSRVLVIDNRFTRLDYGTAYAGGTSGLYRDNLSSGVLAPYTGGIDAGNNR